MSFLCFRNMFKKWFFSHYKDINLRLNVSSVDLYSLDTYRLLRTCMLSFKLLRKVKKSPEKREE